MKTLPKLTPTELKVLTEIATGKNSQKVAEILGCSKRTVDFHLNNVYDKFGVHNRMEAVNLARSKGILR